MSSLSTYPRRTLSETELRRYELPSVGMLLWPLQPRERLPGDIRTGHDIRHRELDLLVRRRAVDTNHHVRILRHLVGYSLLRGHVRVTLVFK